MAHEPYAREGTYPSNAELDVLRALDKLGGRSFAVPLLRAARKKPRGSYHLLSRLVARGYLSNHHKASNEDNRGRVQSQYRFTKEGKRIVREDAEE